MRIAVLGSGNGGLAVAFDCAAHGHEVRLFDFEQFPAAIAAVAAEGGIHAEGDLKGFSPVTLASHDIAGVLQGSELIYAVGPAYSTAPFALACREHLADGQIVIVCPGSCMGAVVFKQAAGMDVADDRIAVAEMSTLPYAVRQTEPGRIRVFLKLQAGILLAALPSHRTAEVTDVVSGVYPATAPAKNVLQTTLQNGNPVIHPAVSLLNAGLIERTGGGFLFYEEGVTEGVGRLIQAVDEERQAIGRALGVEVLPDPVIGCRQGYMTETTYGKGYSEAPGFLGIGAQPSLDHRYIHEDVGYGLVFLRSLARQVGVETPTIDAVIQVASVVMKRDYATKGERTMETLGLSGLSADELTERLS